MLLFFFKKVTTYKVDRHPQLKLCPHTVTRTSAWEIYGGFTEHGHALSYKIFGAACAILLNAHTCVPVFYLVSTTAAMLAD